MKDQMLRRRFLKDILGLGAAVGIAATGIDTLISDEAAAQDEQPTRYFGHEADGYVLTLGGYYDGDKIAQADDTYRRLEFFLRKPTVINNQVYFQEPAVSPIDYNHEGQTVIIVDEIIKRDGTRIIRYSPGPIYVNKSGEVKDVILHEFGHCWFKYMETFVSKEWVDRFNQTYPRSSEYKQGELQAKIFVDHILTKKHSDILQEGLRMYNQYIEGTEEDPRIRIIPPAHIAEQN